MYLRHVFMRLGKHKEMSETVHTAITLALVSGIIMAFVGLIFSRLALEIMGTPDNVIEHSTLYMRIYFLGMPFFMLYNYGAAILRAVGDTKRPLLYLIISGLANACLNLLLVIVFHMGVAGVAIGTVVSQCISCILVLRCLYHSEGSYQLRFSKLTIKSFYLKQIFQVGIPAGIQSTVINLLQCTAAVFRQLFRLRWPWRGIRQQTTSLDFCMRPINCGHTGLHEFYKPELRCAEDRNVWTKFLLDCIDSCRLRVSFTLGDVEHISLDW